MGICATKVALFVTSGFGVKLLNPLILLTMPGLGCRLSSSVYIALRSSHVHGAFLV